MTEEEHGPESHLVRAAIAYLLACGIPVWRNNSGATRIGGRFIRFGMKGSSDIIGLLPPTGRFLAIECKMGRSPLTEDQEAFLDAVVKAGGRAHVARSMNDIERIAREGKGA